MCDSPSIEKTSEVQILSLHNRMRFSFTLECCGKQAVYSLCLHALVRPSGFIIRLL